jgi:hypothetical protein
MSVTVELLYGTQGKREREKGMLENHNITKHNICEDRGYKDGY